MGLTLTARAIRETDLNGWSITHNLAPMAHELGVYQILWRAKRDDTGETILPILKKGRDKLRENWHEMAKLEPENGFGTRETLLDFLEKVIEELELEPDAWLEGSR